MTLRLYTRPGCMACRQTARWLQAHNIPYIPVDVTTTPGATQQLRTLGYQSLPVVAPTNNPDDMWSGFRPDRLRTLEEASQ